ncbi:multiple antibiotic resistance regulatory protein MarB [Shigella flexneri]
MWLFPHRRNNHRLIQIMGTGSDKSDALGVPYYNQHAM